MGRRACAARRRVEGINTQFVRIHLEDGLDEHCERARAAGARITDEPADQFYGARTYRAVDPEGHVWNFSQEVRVVSGEEMEKATGLKIHTSLEAALTDGLPIACPASCPLLWYDKPRAAIAWLETAFGFELQMVVRTARARRRSTRR